jgi:hypothetical protein
MSIDELREQMSRLAVDRIRRVKQLLDAFESGDMPASLAISRIEEVASGDDDRIVRVGIKHTPEIQT